jgi:hypothetical protein
VCVQVGVLHVCLYLLVLKHVDRCPSLCTSQCFCPCHCGRTLAQVRGLIGCAHGVCMDVCFFLLVSSLYWRALIMPC